MASNWSATNRKVVCTISGIDGTNIKSVEYKQTMGTGLTCGTCCSATAEVELTNIAQSKITSLFRRGKAVEIKLGANSADTETITADTSLGMLYVISCELTPFKSTSNYNAKLTLGDAFSLAGFDNAFSALDKSAGKVTEIEILKGIATEVGFEIADESYWGATDLDLSVITEGTTNREVVGWLAGLRGDNAYFDEDGKLTRGFLTIKSHPIDSSLIYLDGFEYGSSGGESEEGSYEETVQVKGMQVTATVDGTSTLLLAGSKADNVYNVKYNCPWMTETVLGNIWSTGITLKTAYDPLTVKWRGNPSIPLMDKLRVDDANGKIVNSFLMERELHYDGGLYEIYKAFEPSDTPEDATAAPSGESGDPSSSLDKDSGVIYCCYTSHNDENPSRLSRGKTNYASVRYISLGRAELICVRVIHLDNDYRIKIPLANITTGVTNAYDSREYNGYPDVYILPAWDYQVGGGAGFPISEKGWYTASSTIDDTGVEFYSSENDISGMTDGYCRVLGNSFATKWLNAAGVSIKIQPTKDTYYDAYLTIDLKADEGYALQDLTFHVLCFKHTSSSMYQAITSIFDIKYNDHYGYFFPYDPYSSTSSTTSST